MKFWIMKTLCQRGAILGDKVMASAILDRIVHHAHILKLVGDSYRIKDFLITSINFDSSGTLFVHIHGALFVISKIFKNYL